MKISSTLLLIAFAACVLPARAETVATVDQFFGSMLRISANQCSNRSDTAEKQYEAQGKKIEAYAMRSGAWAICQCLPERLGKQRASLTKAEATARISESEFAQKYFFVTVNKCAAETLRATYTGECADRYAAYKPDSAKYCSCMSRRMGEFSDDQLAQAGAANTDYAPAAAQAMQRGLPPPELPPILKQMKEADLSCSAR